MCMFTSLRTGVSDWRARTAPGPGPPGSERGHASGGCQGPGGRAEEQVAADADLVVEGAVAVALQQRRRGADGEQEVVAQQRAEAGRHVQLVQAVLRAELETARPHVIATSQ